MDKQLAKALAAHRVTWFGPERPTGNTVFVKRSHEQASDTAQTDHEDAPARATAPKPDA
jgi:hypothetical protein